MFCNQCEQTAKGVGYTTHGVYGKDPAVAALQHLLLPALMGLSIYANEARKKGITDETVNRFTAKAIFSTLTNVDFDPAKFQQRIAETVLLRQQLKAKIGNPAFEHPAANFAPATDIPGLVVQGKKVGLLSDEETDADIRSLQQILRFGVKGVAAYTDHAAVLGQEDDKVYAYLHEALIALTRKDLGINDLLGLVLKCGEMNFRAMELLDAGNTGTYGHPVPTEVPLGHIAGKAILVSGHDLKDLDELLKQTAGKNINVYTHVEMLPTHAYPELKKYQHFYGHYGTAWQNQQKEFTNFPGAILMTTNCLQKPQASYLDHIFTYLGGRTVASRLKPQASYLNHIFTTGNVGWPGVNHLDNYNFTTVIEKALATQGFPTDEARDSVLVGFGRNSVLGVAPKVIDAVKSGDIKHFFLVGGCDGAKPGRSYYSDFVEKAPKDTVILTLACGKFRFFDKKLGDIGGIPRLLDVGQCNDSYSATQIAFAERVSLRPRWLKCNDSYSAIQIALALADAFECDVNELPLTLVLSWYEQKAVAILLTLLHLGLKDIYIGPSLPAFITPNVLNVLVEKFNLHPITTPENDLAQILG